MTRLFAPFVVVMLLVSLAAPASVGPVGTVEAATECDWVDDLIWSIGFGLGSPECAPSKLSDEMEQMQASEDNQTQLDLYNSAVSQADSAETSYNLQDSYLQDTRTTAFIKGENATINAIEAGESASSVNTSARNAVADYYTASQQERLAETWNNQMLGAKYAQNRSEQENLSFSVFKELNPSSDFRNFKVDSFYKEQITLINGTTTKVWVANVSAEADYAGTWEVVTGEMHFNKNRTAMKRNVSSSFRYVDGMQARPPDGSSLEPREYINQSEIDALHTDLDSASTQIQDNVEKYASKLYDADQSGSLNATDYVSPYVQAQEYSTSWNETGYWSYAVSSLSAMGLETPDLNNTGVMNVRYNGVTNEGLIMSDSAPNGSWDVNTTYNASNIEGRQWLVTTAGERLVLKGEFSIEEMTDQQGEQINSTKTVKYVYQAQNESEYEDLQLQVLELQQEIEERAPAGGGGGSGSGLDLGDMEMLLVVVALAVVLIGRNR